MGTQKTGADDELAIPTRRNALNRRNTPSFNRRASAYALNRLADVISGRRTTPRGQGRALLRERRRSNLARAT